MICNEQIQLLINLYLQMEDINKITDQIQVSHVVRLKPWAMFCRISLLISLLGASNR